MTSFRTELKPSPSEIAMSLDHPVFTIGSCFADGMGQNFIDYKFKTLANPFGVTYNPHSIHTQLRYAIHNQPAPDHTFLENNGIHVNYNFHSEFSGASRESLNRKLKDMVGSAHYFLKDARWLIITYGTAWVYIRKDFGEIVANCHKMPGSLFDKELFTQKKMLDSFDEFYKELKSFNPTLQIILTVSPVRHIKDSLELNSVSKAVLRLGCHTLSEQHPDVHYFPAFEILLDDLRDYRFYKNDMLHPSEEAEAYIWEKFTETYLDEEAKVFLARWKSLLAKLRHKPFHPTSVAHQSFLKDLLSELKELKVNVEREIKWVESQLT